MTQAPPDPKVREALRKIRSKTAQLSQECVLYQTTEDYPADSLITVLREMHVLLDEFVGALGLSPLEALTAGKHRYNPDDPAPVQGLTDAEVDSFMDHFEEDPQHGWKRHPAGLVSGQHRINKMMEE